MQPNVLFIIAPALALIASNFAAYAADPTSCEDVAAKYAIEQFNRTEEPEPVIASLIQINQVTGNIVTYTFGISEEEPGQQKGCGIGTLVVTMDLNGCQVQAQ